MLSFLYSLLFSSLPAHSGDLPVKEWEHSAQTPFVLYISGDGGFNNFSTDLCSVINKAGYSVTAVNSKSYFWDKKTPEQSAKDIAAYLDKQFTDRKNQQLVLIGYSFGADVMPFIVNKLEATTKSRIVSVILLSPSTSTDFEIHWSDLFGRKKKRDMDVIAEINKMGAQKTVSISGDDETDFPVKAVILKNYTNVVLPGGHHYDGETETVAKTMMKYFK